MVKNFEIGDAFIDKYHHEYDKDVEKKYKTIRSTVSKELSENEVISKDTFIEILKWKAHRLTGIVKLDQFNAYAQTIHKCFKSDMADYEKLTTLDELYGIGVPVASTILHFMYPNYFPIMDIRTAEVLHDAGYIESGSRSQKNYFLFRKAILKIKENTQNRWSLRQIDMALFAYHEINHLPLTSMRRKACTQK